MADYGSFLFGLLQEDEQRAARLHRESIVIDMTYQGPCSPDVWTEQLRAELPESADYGTAATFLLEKAMRGEFEEYHELFDASGATTGLTGCVLETAQGVLDAGVETARMIAAFEWLRPARRAADIRAAHAAGEHALVGMCQLNLLRPSDIDLLDAAAALGVAHTVDCAYNTATVIGAGCTEKNDPGLSAFGQSFVDRCNKLGVIVDTAHSGPRTTMDACARSALPVVATHTSAAALYECDRAKSDEELQAIAATGGVIGVVAVPFFLTDVAAGPKPTIELTLDHIDYLVRLVGAEHVGLGTDWPLALPADVLERTFLPMALSTMGFRPEHQLDVAATLDGFRDYRDLVNITRGLVARGYADRQIEQILGGNFLRVFEEVVG
ncbi:dipeptidase [Amycolatopsis jejuensis]|uniref:dipeptidase n=1 Tax=Amycolatopsis jejuensis TaxID=330084 RepID=UPI000B2D5B20|nr:membrane dipeptidase [Amycolatopsis jejuensis]